MLQNKTYHVPAETRIGHIHLKVSNLDNSLDFYRDLLGFQVKMKYGDQAVFLSTGEYHHHIGLNTWNSEGAKPASQSGVGMYHAALVYPSIEALADITKRLIEAGYPISGASDHGVSVAVYLRDPDNNGIELYWDKPQNEWPLMQSGDLKTYTKPLDIQELIKKSNY